MSKISTYEVVPVPKLADKLIGTSVGGEIEDATYNFTLQELLDLFLPVIPANNLQGVLDYGNTATQDINLFGTITTTNLDVTDTANLYITYLNEETHIVGSVFDSEDSAGTEGQVLTSTEDGVAWVTLPPIFTPNLQQVLEVGNTSTTGIILDAGLEALDVDTDTATINTNITLDGTITDGNAAVGGIGQVLSSTGTGVEWVSLPVYTATSPLFLNPATNVISIQKATNTQNGYLSSSDWITFDGKQNAGNYITALTGEATASGPGAASVTLGNAAVIGKVLTGFNPTAGTINASDSILAAFGKTQSQINALVGGVQYKGTWNASTNVPTLQSSVGVQGNYYIVNVAGTTNLNGITDWQVGDWAIFSESTWQKVDNTESVVSVNGFTGAVSLTTDNIPEGTTNLYYLDSRARGALSFAAGSGAYNNVSGVITIPTDNSQILNGAGYITLGSLSANAPLTYNPLTGAFGIPKATTLVDGYLSATDWTTFNNKQNYLGGTGLVKSTAGTITYITDNSGNWNTAYDRSIVSAAVTGTTTKTLTLNEQDGNTITASWTDLDTGLTSVGVSMPSAFSVANSPLTSNGTIAITGAGTSLQYIDGTGALQTFPGLTGFVPYTGATTNVDLGEYGISAGYFQADLTPSGTLQVGRMQWNSVDGTMDLRLMGNNVTLQIGEENVTRVVNKSGIDLMEANYQVVRIRKVAEGGAQGQRLAVVLAQGNNENNSTEVLGIVTETILVNQEGFITNFGEVKQINTTGSLQGETWVDGDVVYLSATTPGQLTNIRPVAPNHAVIVGYVTYAHAVNGKIYVAVDTGYELGELHNVYAPSPADKASIWWNASTLRYENNTVAGILGYTPANAATELTINGTTYDLSANRSWSVGTVTSVAALTLGTSGTDLNSSVANGSTTPVITLNVPTASAANRGALSAADWSTFNTKVGSVTASSPLASSGGSTPNITIQQASGSQDGYLSSTDWTTFNNKQAAGNYITSLTGEAIASGPGAASVTLNNASVTAKVLTGINITGGTVQATDTMLTAFGKLQNQINGLVGGSIYQGTWNASTNTPALASGVGTKGYYYIVSVAGNTNLDGITDWFVGDWAIFDGTAWQQVDNTDAVVSVNGQTGAVSLTTDNIPEGATNLYFTDARSRASLSFAAGSGAYNSTSGLITIPTNTNQLTNGASFITLVSLSGSAPIQYNNTTGAISITQSGTASNGYLSSTDWNTFNNKQNALTNPVTGTGTTNYIPKFTGTSTIGNSNFQTDASGNFGLEVTPPAWTFFKAINIFGQSISASSGGGIIIARNWYYDGAEKYYANGSAQRIELVQNGFYFQTAVTNSGGAGAALTWTSPMTLAPTGNLLLNIPTDAGYRFDVGGTSRFSDIALFTGVTTASNGSININSSDPAIRFRYTGGTANARIYEWRAVAGGGVNDRMELRLWNDAETSTTVLTSISSAGYLTSYKGFFSSNGASDTNTALLANASTNDTSSYAAIFGSLNAGYRVVVRADGRLGIGNVNPTELLDVTKNGNQQDLNWGSIMIRNIANYAVGNDASIGFALNNAGNTNCDPRASIGAKTESDLGASLVFNTRFDAGTWAERMRIFSAGNVNIGFGSTNTGFKLDVNGSFRASYVRATTQNSLEQFHAGALEAVSNGNTSRYLQIGYDNGGNFGWIQSLEQGTAYTNLILNGAGGNIGVGTSIPNTYIDGESGMAILQSTNGRAVLSLVGTRTTEGEALGRLSFTNTNATTAGAKRLSYISGYRGTTNNSSYLEFAVANDAIGTGVMWIAQKGQLGVRVLPTSGWGSSMAAIQVGTSGSLLNWTGDNNNFTIGSNIYDDGAGAQRRINASSVSAIALNAGSIYFRSAVSSTAGSSISWNDYMTINSTGAVYVNTTTGVSGGGALQVNGNININGVFQINGVTIGGGGGSGVTGSGTTNYLTKWTGSSTLGNSLITDDGTTVRVNSQLVQGNGGARATNGTTIALTLSGAVYAPNTDPGDGARFLSIVNDNTAINSFAALSFRVNSASGGGVSNSMLDIKYVNTGSSSGSLYWTYLTPSGFQDKMVLTSTGTLLVNTNSDLGGAYKLQVNGGITMAYGYLFNVKGSSGAGDVVIGNTGSTLSITGNVNVGGSVTASGGFFDTSDAKLKTLIQDNYLLSSIVNVKAKYYIKDGRKEIGYFAQDLEDILPSAVTKNDAGILSLAYGQVHTAKIAVIENEVDILKRRVSELEAQLNLN